MFYDYGSKAGRGRKTKKATWRWLRLFEGVISRTYARLAVVNKCRSTKLEVSIFTHSEDRKGDHYLENNVVCDSKGYS